LNLDRKNLETLLSTLEDDRSDTLFLEDVPREQFVSVAENFWNDSPESAFAFIEASKSVLPLLSTEEFNQWILFGKKILDAPPDISGLGSALCREYFHSSPTVLSERSSNYLSYWVEQDLEIAKISPLTAIQYFRSTPAFLQNEELFRLRSWAGTILQILSMDEGSEKVAISYIKSSADLLQHMSFRELKDWFTTGLDIARRSISLASTYFTLVPKGLDSLYSTEWLKICQIGSLLVKTHPEKTIDFYKKTPELLLAVSPAVRDLVLDSVRKVFPEHPEMVARTLDDIAEALIPLSYPVQETVMKYEISIKERSLKASSAYLRNIGYPVEEIQDDFMPCWIEKGISLLDKGEEDGIKYFSIESPESHKEFTKWQEAILLEDHRHILSFFANALTGSELRLKSTEELEPDDMLPVRNLPTGDGRNIYLPVSMAGGKTRRDNFCEYKVAVAHQTGYVAFDTFNDGLFSILSFFKTFALEKLAQDIFFILEDSRIDQELRKEYRGLRVEMDLVLERGMRNRPLLHDLPLQEVLVEILLRLSVGYFKEKEIPRDVSKHVGFIRKTLTGFPKDAQSVWDSFTKTLIIYDYVSKLPADRSYMPSIPLKYRGRLELDLLPIPGQYTSPLDEITEVSIGEEDFSSMSVEGLDEFRKKINIPPDARFIEADEIASQGQFITEAGAIEGKGSQKERDEYDQGRQNRIVIPSTSRSSGQEGPFYYDEWDYLAKGYRSRWCRLHEKIMQPVRSGLVDMITAKHSDLIQRVKKQFQRIRPEILEIIRRVEWGDEIDFPAMVQGVVERRIGISPSEKIFIRRERKIRRISFLFLLDMSASTSEVAPGDGNNMQEEKKIIDIEIESLVVVMEALEALSDEYGIFGFSGYGRENVDFYRIKDFSDSYSESLKHRICGIQPKQGTRMGPAIRHATQKLRSVDSDQRILLLLSDGYPQDHDYGEDRRSKEYGLHDTMMSLLEAKKEGIKPFCITVDQSGNDYLRKMCDPSSYLIIRDIYSLPEMLPKVIESLMA